MQSGSRTENPPGQAYSRLADVIGTFIALLTLILPIVAIANFSSLQPSVLLSPPTNLDK